MKLKNLLITGVLVASMSTGSVAFAATPSTQTNYATTARSNKHEHYNLRLLYEAAKILDIDQTILIDQIQSGQSMSAIAKSYGVTKSYLITQLISKGKAKLDRKVANGTLSPEKETVILFKLTSELSVLMDQTHLIQEFTINKSRPS
ncbi:hypothetical protein JOD43_002383 [Pullulanibacillus pueri]|uniref:Helix-turn-helix domain-containing protein n=1 Tax=Pullulanibacillus pueri TaxID=1437324 RepID=A0A8J2ZV19_9BACL|nr:hypothetical protein [Pullulanibacillus pueri]MBM7682210.1 hypothetical protein [Pullulanibacillus pueri]GGH80458.1 hypothetical protein GCM10007096_16890 [Pullulanibacillus pueri]